MLTVKQFLLNILFVVFFLSMSMRVIAGEGSPPMDWGKVPLLETILRENFESSDMFRSNK